MHGRVTRDRSNLAKTLIFPHLDQPTICSVSQSKVMFCAAENVGAHLASLEPVWIHFVKPFYDIVAAQLSRFSVFAVQKTTMFFSVKSEL